jgi:hypothetical protein
MKKSLLLLAIVLFFLTGSYSQATFNTGALGVEINEYGKIELINADGLYQLWRTSILVGTSETAVFDYQNDAEQNEPTVLVGNPELSDFEIYGAYDNTYSEEPPAVIVKLNAWGWTNGGYIIVRFNITNNETSAMTAIAGLDIIPFIDEQDGYDTVTFNNDLDVIRMHRGTQTNTGIRLLSSDLTSLYSFEYYDDYYVDSDYWTWMNYGSVQPVYPSDSDMGSVSITAQAPVTLAPGESFDVFYAMALGADEATMLANISAAEEKYVMLFTSVPDPLPAANKLDLSQNSPNPASQSTRISYNLPGDGKVSLMVFDVLGNKVATLVNSEQAQGRYNIDYNTEGLAGGIYFYTLGFNDQYISNKMFVIK